MRRRLDRRSGAWVICAFLAVLVWGCGARNAPSSDDGSAAAEVAPARDRHVALEGQPNFRDVGGYETADGRKMKWGEIYRSGQMPDLTDADVERLEELGIRTVVTFLVPKEIEKYGEDRMPAGAEEVRLPIRGENAERLSLQAGTAIRTGDFDALPPDLNPEFHRLLMDDGREEYAELLRMAADPARRPLVFHCSHGVHRTGTATAILLSALGVPWETVREDYLLSNVYRAEEIDHELERIRNAVAENRGVDPSGVDMTNVEAFYRLEGHYIDGALERAIEEHGSMDSFIREGLGITDEEIARLRTELIE
jgi:protein-tyrosine phosphatase